MEEAVAPHFFSAKAPAVPRRGGVHHANAAPEPSPTAGEGNQTKMGPLGGNGDQRKPKKIHFLVPSAKQNQ